MNRIAIVLAIVATFVLLPSAGAAAKQRKPDADARHCLALPTLYAITKCAERYL